MWHRDTKWAKCCWKNGAESLGQCRVGTNLQSVKYSISAKCNKAKHNKTRSACTQKYEFSRFPFPHSPLPSSIPGSLKVWPCLPEQLPGGQGTVTLGMRALESHLCSKPVSNSSSLCDVGQLTYPLWAPVKWGRWTQPQRASVRTTRDNRCLRNTAVTATASIIGWRWNTRQRRGEAGIYVGQSCFQESPNFMYSF